MAANNAEWITDVDGNPNNPSNDLLVIERRGVRPRIYLEINVPGLLFAEKEQRLRGRAAIAAALTVIRQALDTPKALPGFGPDL
jgi:hypothetical protein